MHAPRECLLWRPCSQAPKQCGREGVLSGECLRSLASVGTLLFVALAGCAKKEAPVRPGPPDVAVANAIEQDVPVYNEWVAQLNGPVNADITPKVQGYLLEQNYQNGFLVRKGQLLFTLDPRQYQAALEVAQAQPGA